MKRYILSSILSSIVILACGAMAPQANAQKYAIKVYGDIGLGKAMSITTALPGMTTKSSSNAFGVDFGYTFWRQGGSSLEANIGIGYRIASATFDVDPMSYNYAAPASADEDGNAYQRYVSLSSMSQKLNLGYFKIPIYLEYQYRFNKWVGLHADLGFGFGFRCAGSVGSTTGTATSYGVYPQYDDLVIKADYLNDFGERNLESAARGNADLGGFDANVMCGAGVEIYVAEPVSIDLGVRYNAGLTQVINGKYDITGMSEFKAETAPVTYTVAEGTQVKSLGDYTTKSRLNPLSLHVGLNIRF